MPKDNTNHALEQNEPSGTREAGVNKPLALGAASGEANGETSTIPGRARNAAPLPRQVSPADVGPLSNGTPVPDREPWAGDREPKGRQRSAPAPQQEGPITERLEPDDAEGRLASASASAASGSPRHATTPLSESDYEGGARGRVLPNGTVVGGRYRIMAFLGSPHDTNVYRVSDLEGYRQCWACGSGASMEGDVYCVECGAQLTDRSYRLQEFFVGAGVRGEGLGISGDEGLGISDAAGRQALTPNPSPLTPTLPLPLAILENVVPGVARVYAIVDDQEADRTYVVWEEVYGRALASWLPDFEDQVTGIGYQVSGSTQDRDPLSPFPDPRHVDYVELPATSGQLFGEGVPGEEQALAWMAQAADTLAALHAQDLVNCNIELANLVIQPGDRLTLIDLTGCRSIHEGGVSGDHGLGIKDLAGRQSQTSKPSPPPAGAHTPADAKRADLRNLAGQLERWYLAVRQVEPPVEPAKTVGPSRTIVTTSPLPGAAVRDAGRGEAEHVSPDEITGVLTISSNPAVVLAKAREGAFGSAEELAQALYDLYDASRPITNILLWSGRASDVGQVRQINEDSVLTLEANVLEHDGILPVGVYVVADGMGGHQSGEVASSIAARTIGAVVNTTLIAPLMAGDPVACDASACASVLQQAVMEANRRIASLAQERHSDLGTTVTAALVVGNQLTVANVGDSRTYLWREGELAVITKDHSLVAQLVAAGQIAPGEVYTHPRRNEIYRALGDSHLTSAEVDTFSYILRAGDGVLLCSDGLWDFVRDPIINALIENAGDPQDICQALVDRANTLGGEDNISTIFVRIVAPKSTEDGRET